MVQRYIIGAHEISVTLDPGLVRITNDASLRNLLSRNLRSNTGCLVARIKADYASRMGAPLKIASNSLAVEIWGHLLMGKWARALQQFLPVRPIVRFTGFILRRMEIIDCGETSRDNNRFFWDLLAPFKGLVALLMPGKKP